MRLIVDMSISYGEILDYINTIPFETHFEGDSDVAIEGFCSLKNMRDNCITWIKHTENIPSNCMQGIAYSLVVAPQKVLTTGSHISFIITDHPKAVFFSILHHFFAPKIKPEIVGSSVVKTNMIGQNVSIGDLCFVDSKVNIGDNTVIENNVTIQGYVRIGKNCLIHSGVVIGTDGFGIYLSEEGVPQKVEHFGGVEICDNVEIGANTCIDRGTIDNTYIGQNTKIDNLCHIAHNVHIGESCMLVAQSLVCGSAKLEDYCYLAPGSIIKNQKLVGNNAFVGMGAVVTDDVPNNMIVAGVPARVLREKRENDI